MCQRARTEITLLVFAALAVFLHSQGENRQPLFSDVSSHSGIDFQHRNHAGANKFLIETMGSGCAFLDYDRDGDLDIYFVNGAGANNLYRNDGDGTFTELSAEAGVQGKGYGMGVAVGDLDNDGWPDLYVTNYGPNILYRNRGDGTFEDITAQAGVAAGGWSSSAGFFDFDRDGLLDLYVARYLDWTPHNNRFCGRPEMGRMYCHPDFYSGMPDILFRNLGNAKFQDVSQAAGIASPLGKGLGVAFADYDADGWTDIFVANDSVRCFLYHNNTDGTFTETGLSAGAAVKESGQTFAGMGVDFNDYDNDGMPDLFITDLSGEMYVLFRNTGKGFFRDVTHRSGIGRISYVYSGWGTRFIDFDNDGWKDLFCANSHVLDNVDRYYPHLSYLQRPLLLENRRGIFHDASQVLGATGATGWAGRGAAFGDYDNDGDMDIVVSNCGQKAYLLRNDHPPSKNWLTLDLEGKVSNRDGLGTQVHLLTTDGSRQHSQATTAGSYLSASDKRVHFGLGTRTIKRVEIDWPSGVRQILTSVPAGKILPVQESKPSSE